MADYRIKQHPILPIPPINPTEIFWKNKSLIAQQGEMIASALFANGIRVFGHHHKDGSPQGIFCANGQCSQCMVLANDRPVKACMEPVSSGLRIEPVDQLPVLTPDNQSFDLQPISEFEIPVLIIGGGPSGLSAAIELGKLGIKTILVDDKHRLGGKLVLQTHRFFGSADTVYAGTRGIDIAVLLENEVRQYPTVDIWLRSTALAVFSDGKIGVLKENERYVLVKPQVLLSASGAREKSLTFQGNTLPGVYGAGAFQTLVNRDLVKPAEALFIVGGGNVGLIAGYHALQAMIAVVGLVEALPECGGYKVHRDKLARMGVPIYTSHTIVSANGTDDVTSVTIAEVNNYFNVIPGTEKSFACDTVLIAVGLDPVNEFFTKAKEYGLKVFSAGDSEEIAEASAAMFSGKIKGLEIAQEFSSKIGRIPDTWYQTCQILKSKPGIITQELVPDSTIGVMPIIHCSQEIPCDPCSTACPRHLITIDISDIRHLPQFSINDDPCAGCERCVTFCPGLAITLVDFRKNEDFPTVSIPYEYSRDTLLPGQLVTVVDTQGLPLGELPVQRVLSIKDNDRTAVVLIKAPQIYAKLIAGIQIQNPESIQPVDEVYLAQVHDDAIICRCERVTAGEIRALIRKGYRDLNEIKTVTRAGMGACGSKTCNTLIHRLFKDEGVPLSQITAMTHRPLFVEVPLGMFAGIKPTKESESP